MVVRIFYRAVSLFFYLCALATWAIGIVAIAGQIGTGGFNLTASVICAMSVVLGLAAWAAGRDAWWSARHC